VTGTVSFDAKRGPAASATLHVRLPGDVRVTAVDAGSGATVLPDGSGIRWESPRGRHAFRIEVR
jgi:hypothetical protein